MRQKWVRNQSVIAGQEAEDALLKYTRFWDELPSKLQERETSMRPLHLEALLDEKLSDGIRKLLQLEIDNSAKFIEEHKEYAEKVGT